MPLTAKPDLTLTYLVIVQLKPGTIPTQYGFFCILDLLNDPNYIVKVTDSKTNKDIDRKEEVLQASFAGSTEDVRSSVNIFDEGLHVLYRQCQVMQDPTLRVQFSISLSLREKHLLHRQRKYKTVVTGYLIMDSKLAPVPIYRPESPERDIRTTRRSRSYSQDRAAQGRPQRESGSLTRSPRRRASRCSVQ